MVRFSFVVPVYNVAPYLNECLDSILSQDFKDYEVCLIDDGSTDGGGEICDAYAAKDTRVNVVHQENSGVSAARNKALAIAKGEYVWFVDADDCVESGALGFLDRIISASGCDTVFFGHQRKAIDDLEVEYHTEAKNVFLCKHICYCNPLMIFRRSIIEDNNIRFTLGMKMAEDLEFQYKYLLHCLKPVAIDYDFYYIRQRSDSASRNDMAKQNNFEGNRIILSSILDYVKTIPDKGLDWLGLRMAERVKSLMQSSFSVPFSASEKNKLVRATIMKYKSLGYEGFDDVSFGLALIDVRLYYFFYKIVLKLKGVKR